jgi:hypothetical protein
LDTGKSEIIHEDTINYGALAIDPAGRIISRRHFPEEGVLDELTRTNLVTGTTEVVPILDDYTIWDFDILTLPDTPLQPGDANQGFDFDQLDLVKVQQAAKYLTGQTATWGEGDWDGAPGGAPDFPPRGNGVFDQLDLLAALVAGVYLTGPYASLQPDGQRGDDQCSVIYDASTGEISIDAPGVELTSLNIVSAAGVFTSDPAENLGGSFDNDADNNIFKATFGSSFGSLSFGNVAPAGLAEAFLLDDLTVVGSLAGGGDLGQVDLIYVPEPSTLVLLAVGMLVSLGWRGRRS